MKQDLNNEKVLYGPHCFILGYEDLMSQKVNSTNVY